MDWRGTEIDVGEGVRLRAWRADDLESLLRHADDEEVSRGVGDRFPWPYARADGEAFLSGKVIDFEAGPAFAIDFDGEAIGSIGARPGQGERRHSAEFGYWLGRKQWGRGLMTRVVAAFAPWAMRELRLYRLQASVLDFNLGSARVLEKNGFAEEGLQRKAVFKRGRVHDLRVFAKTRERLDDGA